MKRFRSEFVHSYATYSFGYCEYALREKSDALSELYAQGFLPYTGSPDVADTLYMARSARLRLRDFLPSSENRRILKRFDGTLVRTVTPLADFDANATFKTFCLDYFAKRHGTAMPKERFETVLASGFITSIATYTKDGTTMAYVLLAEDTACSHYWFSFYDLAYVRQSLGLWLMLDCARSAHAEKKTHFYVGTVYGEKGLYKTNFPGLEYWDGNGWSSDLKELRALCRRDDDTPITSADRWKQDALLF